MRIIAASEVQKMVSKLFLKAGTEIRPDILKALKRAVKSEKNRLSREMLQLIIENSKIAKSEKLPLCQDTGLPIVFIEIGEEVFVKGSLKDAVIKGAADAYRKYAYRRSVVVDPVLRNPPFKAGPALLHMETVKGKTLKLTVMAKGFGSENKTKLKMMNPTADIDEIEDFIVSCIRDAGPDACPPYIVGVGIGGVAETANLLAKKALLLPIGNDSKKKHLALMEKRILKKINDLDIGVMGLGGKATCLKVNILTSPTHIAGLPIAVNIGCHATRSARCTI